MRSRRPRCRPPRVRDAGQARVPHRRPRRRQRGLSVEEMVRDLARPAQGVARRREEASCWKSACRHRHGLRSTGTTPRGTRAKKRGGNSGRRNGALAPRRLHQQQAAAGKPRRRDPQRRQQCAQARGWKVKVPRLLGRRRTPSAAAAAAAGRRRSPRPRPPPPRRSSCDAPAPAC